MDGRGDFHLTTSKCRAVFDVEAAEHYNYFRDYDPAIGRYVQSDPIGLAGGANTFAYVGSGPMVSIDPYGLIGMADMPLFPNWAVDFSAGFGDSMTLNATSYLRELVGGGRSVRKCSAAYRAGEIADIAFEVGTMGLSALLKAAARGASREAARAEFRMATSDVSRNGGQLHHRNPLFGHPDGSTTIFPTGGLPSWVAHGSWNLQLFASRAEHLSAHARLQSMERAWSLAVRPGLTGARAAKDFAQACECPN